MAKEWFRLDTAALIFPVVAKRNWSNVFRMSAEMSEPVDPDVLQQAVDDLMPRFPTFYVRLCTGFFWYYLEQLDRPPSVQEDFAYPVTHMGRRERSRCCLRVLYFRNRIAVEFFHALTDGSGGSIYLQTLLSRYISLRYGETVEPSGGVLSPEAPPSGAELEDSFFRYAASSPAGRNEATAYRLTGTREPFGFRYLITGKIPTAALLDTAHRYSCTVTAFLAAVMTESIISIQAQSLPSRRWKPVKITIPVNMRRLYGSKTLRNFALTLNLGVDPRYGTFSLQDLCSSITHQLAAEATPQNMAARIAANVMPQESTLIKLCPLPVKNLVMELVYNDSGERKGCLNISNLGPVRLPEPMQSYVRRMDFIVGCQRSYPNNCSVLSYGGMTCINMIRNIQESELERRFFSRLVELGIPVEIESNRR